MWTLRYHGLGLLTYLFVLYLFLLELMSVLYTCGLCVYPCIYSCLVATSSNISSFSSLAPHHFVVVLSPSLYVPRSPRLSPSSLQRPHVLADPHNPSPPQVWLLTLDFIDKLFSHHGIQCLCYHGHMDRNTSLSKMSSDYAKKFKPYPYNAPKFGCHFEGWASLENSFKVNHSSW